MTALQYTPSRICYEKIRSIFLMLLVIINSLSSTWGIAMKILKSVKLLTTHESYTLSVTKDFIHAMATILAAHYVFKFAYASKPFDAMYFIQKYLLGIDDETKCPSKVLKLFSKLVKTNAIQ